MKVCEVAQLRVESGAYQPTDFGTSSVSDGWYYDDFSPETAQLCTQGSSQRIAFTGNAQPPPGVRIVLDCAP